MKLRCPKNELTGPCRGKLKLKTRKRVKTSGKKRKLKLAKRKYELDAGKAKRLKLKLSGRERALLAREPAARRLQATASVRDTLGNTGRAKRKLRVPG